MGWNVEHDTSRSATNVHRLGRQLAHVTPSRDWRVVRSLFNRRSGDPFTVSPKDAGRMASVLRAAASHPKMSANWAQETLKLANAADTAARTNKPWNWN